MSPTGIDESWSFASPTELKRMGVQVVSLYLSWDQSKNVTAAKVLSLHHAGIAVLLNWESQAGAPLKGKPQGLLDATEARRQVEALIKSVGYAPKNRATIYNSCDADVSLAQIQGPCAAYYRATASVYRPKYGNGAYGEKDLVAYLAANHITDSEWQTYAWSGGQVSPAADFYQYLNGQTIGGASVDFDKVIHAAALGAWWPPNSPHNTNGTEEFTVTPADEKKIADMISASESRMKAEIESAKNSVIAAVGRVIHNKDGHHPNALDELGPYIRGEKEVTK